MNTVIMITVIMGAVGIFFGFVLAFANKKLAEELNPLIHIVEDILPKGQCGACGYAGCQAYAKAVVLEKDVPPNLCLPGKAAIAKKIAELTSKKSEEIEPRIAYVKCTNPIKSASKKFEYTGIDDCIAANILHSGPKDCQYGCIGLGTCARNCPFDAILLNSEGLPIVDPNKCTGCGKCETTCPKGTIQMVPLGSHVAVACNSKDKGASARKYCTTACLGCGICSKQCPHGAIKIEENLAIIDPHICVEKCNDKVCLSKCPTGAIKKWV
jgi:Na+-translocating ferredoxin:NAD+ oxidoreductase RNF subunit RnfB